MKPSVPDDEKCLPWSLSAMRAAIAPPVKVPSKARHEFEIACNASHDKRFGDAEQHLHLAIGKFQDYSAAWVMLGVVLDEQHKEQEARDACSRATTINGKYLPAYLCSAEFSARNREWPQLSTLADAALGLNSENDAYAYYYKADADFHLKHLADAQKSALHAAEIDAKHEYLPLYFLLAQIYEAQGDRATAETYLRQTLKHATNPAQKDAIQQYLADLETKAAVRPASETETAKGARAEEVAEIPGEETVGSLAELGKADESWVPADIDHADLTVASGVACPLPEVLNGVSQRILELVRNTERFSATEMLLHQAVDRAGRLGPAVTAQFNYLVSYSADPSGFLKVDEYRNGSVSNDGFPSHIATIGTPSLVLIFHPRNIGNFKIECEGLGHWHGEPAWQIRFEQRADRPNTIYAFTVERSTYSVNLRGRAWILADSFQVARLETDLADRIPQIRLNLDHQTIEYGPVASPTDKVQLWLPATAEVYMDFLGRRFYRKHSFTDFKIFSVDSQYRVTNPKGAPAEAPADTPPEAPKAQ